jgi:hypothetical protein
VHWRPFGLFWFPNHHIGRDDAAPSNIRCHPT